MQTQHASTIWQLSKLSAALLLGGAVLAGALTLSTTAQAQSDRVELLNVSYDPTREFYREYNAIFSEHWQEEHDQAVNVRQSHGGRALKGVQLLMGWMQMSLLWR